MIAADKSLGRSLSEAPVTLLLLPQAKVVSLPMGRWLHRMALKQQSGGIAVMLRLRVKVFGCACWLNYSYRKYRGTSSWDGACRSVWSGNGGLCEALFRLIYNAVFAGDLA